MSELINNLEIQSVKYETELWLARLNIINPAEDFSPYLIMNLRWAHGLWFQVCGLVCPCECNFLFVCLPKHLNKHTRQETCAECRELLCRPCRPVMSSSLFSHNSKSLNSVGIYQFYSLEIITL